MYHGGRVSLRYTGQEKRRRDDLARMVSQQRLAVPKALVHQAELETLEIAESAVDQPR